jgi:hypothetical protein
MRPPSAFDEDWPAEIKRECSPDAPCGRLTCAACSDPQRLRWIRRTLAITKAHPGQHEIATIVLPGIPPALLHAKIIRSRVLRGVFEKADFQGELLRGGIDVWNDSWMCARVLAIGVPREAWARLRALVRNANAKYNAEYSELIYLKPSLLLKVQPLRDPEKQIAGLVKFPTYFWPRTLSGAARAGSVPPDHLKGLADWASDHTFKDFTFEFGKATARKSSGSREISGDR